MFLVSMLTMTASSVYLAYVHSQPANLVVGALTFYLVATAWVTVFRTNQRTGLFEVVAVVVVVTIAATALRFGLEAADATSGRLDGTAPANFYFVAAIAAGFGVFDAKAILHGGLVGRQRILRHLWRMCFAMFIATLSFFVGQPQIFPESLRGSLLLASPVIAVAIVTTFWLVRVRFRRGDRVHSRHAPAE
ncbi:MAG: hypothetical protein O7G86_03255 [Gammaproteobacteria bacterium]|nr:hypothetical protein [Gammaproteobacteria bacterium]